MGPESSKSESLDYLRTILVKTLSSENVGRKDVLIVNQFKIKKKAAEIEVDKDLRLKNLKEKQNEERHRKLEELKAQALAAQRFKEQKEQERRHRLEELRLKEDSKRMQVEERKRAINDAERDRMEAILRRNQQRDERMETKKRNERSNIVFAFGSSTPRNLAPHDIGSSFWGRRKATSTQNITTCTAASLTRRQSERDLDNGSKKRATSAGGADRANENGAPTTPAGCASGYLGRRRTDLMPTIPREVPYTSSSSRKSLNHSPGRAYSMTRLDQLSKPRKRHNLPSSAIDVNAQISHRNPSTLSSSRLSSITRSMSHLAVSNSAHHPPHQSRKSLNKSDSRSMHHLAQEGSFVLPRTTRATQLRQQKLYASSSFSDASSRPSSSMSQQSTTSVTSSVSVRHRPSSGARKPRPVSIAITGITQDQRTSLDKSKDSKPPLPKTRRSITKSIEKASKSKTSSGASSPKNLASPTLSAETKINGDVSAPVIKPPDTAPEPQQRIIANEEELVNAFDRQTNLISDVEVHKSAVNSTTVVDLDKEVKESANHSATSSAIQQFLDAERSFNSNKIQKENIPVIPQINDAAKSEKSKAAETRNDEADKNSSILTNSLIDNTEMSASMTRSRIINTEEEAKAALAERRRLAREEAERKAEQERLQKEKEAREELEKQQREEEQVRQLIEAQRVAEQQRLDEAIKEAQKKDEEERKRKEEEMRAKQLKEEADKKAREEAEKAKAEQQERLKMEEKQREERRKRVEAIMLRTRGKTNENSAQKENSENTENKSENKVNGTKTLEQENGTKNGKEQIIDNIIPDATLKNANTVSIDSINDTTDSRNSNNPWQPNQQYGNFVCNNNR